MTVSLTAAGWIPKYGGGTAGWGCFLRYEENYKTLQGAIPTKSENRSELSGIVAGLQQLKWPCIVNVYTANEYLHGCGKRALRRKRSDGFVCDVANGTAKNADLWKAFQAAGEVHRIQMCWVPFRSKHKDCGVARNAASSGSLAAPRPKALPATQVA